MLPRYSDKTITSLWADNNKYALWAAIEKVWMLEIAKEFSTLTAKELHQLGDFEWLPDDDYLYTMVRSRERETGHDVRAFLLIIQEALPPFTHNLLHLFLTSSDLVDTTMSILMAHSFRQVFEGLQEIRALLNTSIWKSSAWLLERTHGQPADTITIYEKSRQWITRLAAIERTSIPLARIKLGGPIGGSFQNIHDRALRARVIDAAHKAAWRLGNNLLIGVPCSREQDVDATQCSSRIWLTDNMYKLWRVSAALAQLASDLWSLCYRGLLTIQGPSSSAMPHKTNPTVLERVIGMERLVQGYAVSCMQNSILRDNRDLAHSSVERVVVPDAFHAVLRQLTDLQTFLQSAGLLEESMHAEAVKAPSSNADMAHLQLWKGLSYTEAWDTIYAKYHTETMTPHTSTEHGSVL